MVDTTIRTTRIFHALLQEHPCFEPLHAPEMNVQLFRATTGDARKAYAELTSKGKVWASLASWKGEAVYRAVVLSPETGTDELESLLAGLEKGL